jgi:hypothetical protein
MHKIILTTKYTLPLHNQLLLWQTNFTFHLVFLFRIQLLIIHTQQKQLLLPVMKTFSEGFFSRRQLPEMAASSETEWWRSGEEKGVEQQQQLCEK